jgi:hypothetical protein
MSNSKSKSDEGLSCSKFNKFIKIAWQYDKQVKIYEISPDNSKFLIKHKTCLYGLSESEVIGILGEPSSKIYGGFLYYTNEKCNRKPQKYCEGLQVKFNTENNLVEDVRFSGYKIKY